MAKTFEDLDVWREAREITAFIYKMSGCGSFAGDRVLGNQMRRAMISVMSNIAEGFCRGGNKELAQFLFIARGSLAEVNSQLYIASDLGCISNKEFTETNNRIKLLSRRLTAFINKINTSRRSDSKAI